MRCKWFELVADRECVAKPTHTEWNRGNQVDRSKIARLAAWFIEGWLYNPMIIFEDAQLEMSIFGRECIPFAQKSLRLIRSRFSPKMLICPLSGRISACPRVALTKI